MGRDADRPPLPLDLAEAAQRIARREGDAFAAALPFALVWDAITLPFWGIFALVVLWSGHV